MAKMDAPEWTNSMCKNIVRLSQGWGKNAGTYKIESIFHKDKPKDIKATYVRAVCDIRLHKTETHNKILTSGVNLIDYPGDVRTPTSDFTTMKLHVKSAISDV